MEGKNFGSRYFEGGAVCGINTPKEELTQSQLYQAVHNELVASAWAVKLGTKLILHFKLAV